MGSLFRNGKLHGGHTRQSERSVKIITPDTFSPLASCHSTFIVLYQFHDVPRGAESMSLKHSNIECVTSDILKAKENKRNVRVRPETKPVATAQNTSPRSRRELVNLLVSCRNQTQTHEERVNRRYVGRSHDSIAVSPTRG